MVKIINELTDRDSRLFTRREAANYLGLASKTLAAWSSSGRHKLPMVKIGRLVRYRKSDLDLFVASNQYIPHK